MLQPFINKSCSCKNTIETPTDDIILNRDTGFIIAQNLGERSYDVIIPPWATSFQLNIRLEFNTDNNGDYIFLDDFDLKITGTDGGFAAINGERLSYGARILGDIDFQSYTFLLPQERRYNDAPNFHGSFVRKIKVEFTKRKESWVSYPSADLFAVGSFHIMFSDFKNKEKE